MLNASDLNSVANEFVQDSEHTDQVYFDMDVWLPCMVDVYSLHGA